MAKVAEEHRATAKSGKGIAAKRPGRATLGTEEVCLMKLLGTRDKSFGKSKRNPELVTRVCVFQGPKKNFISLSKQVCAANAGLNRPHARICTCYHINLG